MQGVRQSVLYLTRGILPMGGIAQPAGRVVDEGPVWYLGEPRRQSVEIAVDAVLRRDMTGKPIVRDSTRAHDKAIDRKHEFRMRRRRHLTIIGDLAAFPEARDIGPALRRTHHFFVAGGDL